MRASCVIALLPLLSTSAALARGPEEGTCRVFILKSVDGELTVETRDLQDGQVESFQSSHDTGVIDVICPVGPGGSGSVARLRDNRMLIARCTGGALEITDRAANGKEWTRPARKREDLAQYDVRVSVTGADGSRNAFLIRQNKAAAPDDVGPVFDMFAGKIPMSAGDYSIFTDTYRHDLGVKVSGETPLELDRWPLVKAKFADGREGDFIIDIGAGTTVVSRAMLPEGTSIEKAAMVQYSAAGKKMLKYTPGGATGQVETVLGHATLPEMRVGEILFRDVTVDVLKEVPDIFGRPIAGILGLDLLGQCEVLSFVYPASDKSAATLRLGDNANRRGGDVLEVPFTIIRTHLVVTGAVNGVPVHFVLDSGAPTPFLDRAAAKSAGVKIDEGSGRKGRGLDGGAADIHRSEGGLLKLGDRNFPDITFRVSALHAFSGLNAHGQNVGLLGNSFFQQFKRFDIDFDRRVVRFVE